LVAIILLLPEQLQVPALSGICNSALKKPQRKMPSIKDWLVGITNAAKRGSAKLIAAKNQ
jgi:hypothetical protein